jgi:hypothetical protein
MAKPDGRPLSFDVVDELAFAAARGIAPKPSELRMYEALSLGPLIELRHLYSNGLVTLGNKGWRVAISGYSELRAQLRSPSSFWISHPEGRDGFIRARVDFQNNGTDLWDNFIFAAFQAAQTVGFPKETARQLVAAMIEMYSNIVEHSDNVDSGLVCFHARPNYFEWVVCDAGIGVLASLRTCTEFSSLRDHGDAMMAALADTNSRFGKGVGRGYGFRPLFTGLANLNGFLRFRSGDASVTMDGRSPSLVSAQLRQKPLCPGLVAHVACTIGQP